MDSGWRAERDMQRELETKRQRGRNELLKDTPEREMEGGRDQVY